MLDHCDVVLIDLQDLGCRIYTFITTLRYVLEAAARHGKAVWVLDRPNPVGRPIEGLTLREGWKSFVGAGAMPMRHGLTMGELAPLVRARAAARRRADRVIDHGWLGARARARATAGRSASAVWINPSPNAPNVFMARAYAGTVMLEGTTLSEGRGTTPPAGTFRRPDIDARQPCMAEHAAARAALARKAAGCASCWFEPTFHKHVGKLCSGRADPHRRTGLRPRAPSGPGACRRSAFKAIRNLAPGYAALARLPLRVRDRQAGHRRDQRQPAFAPVGRRSGRPRPADLDAVSMPDESAWAAERQPFLRY
jgi:hypothetical protein